MGQAALPGDGTSLHAGGAVGHEGGLGLPAVDIFPIVGGDGLDAGEVMSMGASEWPSRPCAIYSCRQPGRGGARRVCWAWPGSVGGHGFGRSGEAVGAQAGQVGAR